MDRVEIDAYVGLNSSLDTFDADSREEKDDYDSQTHHHVESFFTSPAMMRMLMTIAMRLMTIATAALSHSLTQLY